MLAGLKYAGHSIPIRDLVQRPLLLFTTINTHDFRVTSPTRELADKLD